MAKYEARPRRICPTQQKSNGLDHVALPRRDRNSIEQSGPLCSTGKRARSNAAWVASSCQEMAKTLQTGALHMHAIGTTSPGLNGLIVNLARGTDTNNISNRAEKATFRLPQITPNCVFQLYRVLTMERGLSPRQICLNVMNIVYI